jgi:hypothetical protein
MLARQYPIACSPQAWSTGAPLLLLRTMLGLEPEGDHLVVDPALPRTIGRLELLDIPAVGDGSTPSAAAASMSRVRPQRAGDADEPASAPPSVARELAGDRRAVWRPIAHHHAVPLWTRLGCPAR